LEKSQSAPFSRNAANDATIVREVELDQGRDTRKFSGKRSGERIAVEVYLAQGAESTQGSRH
jgi:hypothetical protein